MSDKIKALEREILSDRVKELEREVALLNRIIELTKELEALKAKQPVYVPYVPYQPYVVRPYWEYQPTTTTTWVDDYTIYTGAVAQ